LRNIIRKIAKVTSQTSVDEAINWIENELVGTAPAGAGIDTLLYWEDTRGGWRVADERLKNHYQSEKQSIVSPNSLHGDMAVQGMTLALRLRQKPEELPASE